MRRYGKTKSRMVYFQTQEFLDAPGRYFVFVSTFNLDPNASGSSSDAGFH